MNAVISDFEGKLASDRQRFIDLFPGGGMPGTGMGAYTPSLIVDSICIGAIQHLRTLSTDPVLLHLAALVNTDLGMGNDGFQSFGDTLYSHIQALFVAAKRGFGG